MAELSTTPMGPEEEEEWNRLDRLLNGSNAIITSVDYSKPVHPTERQATIPRPGMGKGLSEPAPGRQG